jgi:2,5-diamino-6-(ribosylamino)-4(3H)-pyrimidinone 5'-phosphate reductase
MSRQNALPRPHVIVSSTASLDGRITLSRPERLLTPDVDRRWKSHWPPDVPDLIAQRAANIEERHHPTVFLEGSGTFVADTAGPYLAWLRTLEVPYLLAGDDRVDLPLALNKIRHLLGAACVVCEGGGGINGALLRGGLVDEVQMIWFPAVVGGADTPSSFDGDSLTPGKAPLSMTHRETIVGRHGSIWSRYESAADTGSIHDL